MVRPAAEGERFTTLDGEDRQLVPDMTVIATPERAVALAHVGRGGACSQCAFAQMVEEEKFSEAENPYLEGFEL